ncbi:MAG: DUF4252 domain-containing protein [Syntrophomonadaceae bacterium]
MKKLISVLIFCAAVLYSNSFAQNTDYKKEAGYIEFGDLSSLETGDNVTEVLLDEKLLKLAAGVSKKDNQELKNLLGGLKLVKVNSFGVSSKNESRIISKMNSLDADLTGKNWDRIVKTRENGATTNVYIKTNGGNNVVGLVVTTLSTKGEASFINIVGKIDLETISNLSDNFSIPSLDSVGHKKRH